MKTTIKELAELILDVMGSNLKIKYEPGGMTFVKNRIGNPAKAKEEIGFVAGIPLHQGLKDLIDWRNDHKAEVERRRRVAGIAN